MPAHEDKTGPASLRMLIAIGIVTACGPQLIDDDEPSFRRCVSIVGTGVTVDGEQRRTDYDQDHTHQLCTCSTAEEAADFSPGGYREYINELGFEMCKELVEDAGILDDDCQEHYESNLFALSYGFPPTGAGPEVPRCDDENTVGCQG